MTAPITITIAGNPYTSAIQDSLSIKAVIGKTPSTIDAIFFDKSAALLVPEGVDIIVTRTDTSERIFGGLTSMVSDWTEGVSRYFQIQGQSYTVLLDRIIFYAAYGTGYSDKDILTDLFTSKVVGSNGQIGVSSEITVGSNVKIGQTGLTPLTFVYSYAREAIELLAGYVGYNYYVDFNKDLHYYHKESVVAPYGLSSSPNNTTTIGYNNLRRRKDATRVINNYLVFGPSLTSKLQEDFCSNDGSKTVISVAFKGSAVSIYAPPGEAMIKVWVNTGTDITPTWVTKTVGLYNSDSLSTKDCLFDPSALTLTFGTAPLNLTKAVKVNYSFPYSAGSPRFDAGSYAQYGRIFSNKLVASDLNSAGAITSKLNNLAEQYKSALHTITLRVDDTMFPGTTRFAPGQWVYLYNEILGISKSYVIYSITTKILGGVIKSYDLELRSYTLE